MDNMQGFIRLKEEKEALYLRANHYRCAGDLGKPWCSTQLKICGHILALAGLARKVIRKVPATRSPERDALIAISQPNHEACNLNELAEPT